MGQFTEGEVIITTKSKKSALAIAKQINNLDKYIKSKSKEPFHTSVSDVDVSDSDVYVKLCSDRYPNAEWQCQQILSLVKDKFKSEVNTFTADLTVPENIIYENFDDEGGKDE